MKELSELSLADLIALFNDFMSDREIQFLDIKQAAAVKEEIERRLSQINFH